MGTLSWDSRRAQAAQRDVANAWDPLGRPLCTRAPSKSRPWLWRPSLANTDPGAFRLERRLGALREASDSLNELASTALAVPGLVVSATPQTLAS